MKYNHVGVRPSIGFKSKTLKCAKTLTQIQVTVVISGYLNRLRSSVGHGRGNMFDDSSQAIIFSGLVE